MDPVRLLAPGLKRSNGSGGWYGGSGTTRSVGKPLQNHATISRCIDVLTAAAMEPDPIVVEGFEDPEVAGRSNPWVELFADPNPSLSRREFWRAFWTLRFLDGEVFLVGASADDRPLDPTEVPGELWPVASNRCTEILDPRTRLVVGWRVTGENGSGGALLLPASEVVQFRRFNPYRTTRGLAELDAARSAFVQDVEASTFQEAFYRNGTVLSGVLTSDQNLTREQMEDLREAWAEKHRGGIKAYRDAVLGSGLTYQGIGTPQRDAQHFEGRAWNRDEIAMVLGVNPYLLGVTENINYATSIEAKRTLWENKMLAEMRALEDVLAARLFRDRGQRPATWLRFDTDQVAALQADLTEKLAQATSLTALGYPVNEVNERLGLGMPEQPWGDVGTLPMGVAPADSVVLDMGVLDLGSPTAPLTASVGALEAPSTPPLLEEPRNREDAAENARADIWRAFDKKVLGPGERLFRRIMRRHFMDARSEVLRFLSSRRSNRTIDSDLRKFLDEALERWNARIWERTRPVYERILQASSADLGAGFALDVENPEVLEFLAGKEMRIVGINETVESALRRSLLEGVGTGETIQDLRQRTKAIMNVADSRALTIARTETAQAANTARNAAMVAAGVPYQEWISSRDARVRDEHRELDGEVRPVGDSFIADGTLRYPGDPLGPAHQVINCRCVAVPAAPPANIGGTANARP